MRIILLLFGLSLFSLSADGQNFFDLYTIQDIRVMFDSDNWDKKLAYTKKTDPDRRHIGQVNVNGILYDSAGIRYKGNSSFFSVSKKELRKLPFNIKLNYIKKKQSIPGGNTKIKLSNVFRDPSFVREVISYEIAGDYMPAPQANFARLHINGEWIGFYNNVESIEKAFVKRHFGTGKGFLYKCDPESWDITSSEGCPAGEFASLVYLGPDSTCYMPYYELKSGGGWSHLIELMRVLKEEPENIETILNVDQVLWMLAFNNVLVNLDSYTGRLSHNYYLYRDTFGYFHPIIWDLNMSFGGFTFDGIKPGSLSMEELTTMSPFIHFKNEKRPLISNLLSQPEYRKLYVAHLRTILNDHFVSGNYERKIREVQQFIDLEVQNDKNKLYPYITFKSNAQQSQKAGKVNVVGIEELMQQRVTYLQNHAIFKKPAPVMDTPTHSIQDSMVKVSVQVADAEKVYLKYRRGNGGPFTSQVLLDDGEGPDGLAGDDLYSGAVPHSDDLEYYVVAFSEYSATCRPEKASYQTIKLNMR